MIFNIYKRNNVIASWVNQNIEKPVFHVFFSMDAEFDNMHKDLWWKLVVPFKVDSLNSKWNIIENCCSINNLLFLNTEEIIIPDNNKTIVYIKLINSVYKKNQIYVWRIIPNKYLIKIGFSDLFQIFLVSNNSSDSIIYAYNKAFFRFYMHKQPSNNLILRDNTLDENRFLNGKLILSKIIIKNEIKNIRRIIINLTGEYKFSSNHDCKWVKPILNFKCDYWNEVGIENKKKYLELILIDSELPKTEIEISYNLNTPNYSSKHSLKIFLMALKAPIIYVEKKLNNIFKTKNNTFDWSYPKLIYSFNLDAADINLKDEIGLYSMGNGYNLVYNSLLFKIKTNQIYVQPLENELSKIEIYIGDENAIVPLGYVFNNFGSIVNKKIFLTYNKGILTINNIKIENEKEYSIGLKVGFKNPMNLRNDLEKGFGLIIYYINKKIILKDRAKYRTNFNKIYKNYSLILPENQVRNSSNNRLQRTYSAFRSGNVDSIINISNYRSTSILNGLRKGNNLGIWFTSSVGPNSLYYDKITDFSNYHNSNRTFVDIYTDKSITTSNTNFSDLVSSTNCKFFSSAYNIWSDQITRTQAQSTLTGITINTDPSNYNFLGGCLISKIENKYTRLRMRFTNKYFVDSNNRGNFIIGAKFPFINDTQKSQTLPIEGSVFIWKNIDITKFSNWYPKDNEYSILDSFVLFHFFAEHEDTTKDIKSDSEISILDNMYVLSNTDSNIQTSNINFNLLYSWLINSSTIPNYNFSGNKIDNWPNVLHISGQFGNISDSTKYILFFFEFLEPIEFDELTKELECKGNGLRIVKCKKIIGHYDNNSISYVKAVQPIPGQVSQEEIFPINPRVSYGIEIEFEDSPKSATFSISFPVKHIFSLNVNNIAKLNSGTIPASPSFMVIDNNLQITDYIDYGCGANYILNSFDSSRIITNFITWEIQPANIKMLDDNTPNNNPVNSVWISKENTNPKWGTKANLKLKVNCDTSCTKPPTDLINFSGALYCDSNKFYEESDFEVNNLISDIRGKCNYFGYIYNKKIKYCLHCPGVENVANPNLDASALSFSINNFKIPDYIGRKFSLDAVTVLGKPNLSSFLKPNLMNFEFSTNLITPLIEQIELNQEKDSIILEFDINIKTRIPKDGIIFFGFTSGCEQILKLNGDNTNQICEVILNENIYKCTYGVNTGGIQINLLSLILPGDLKIKIWGISIGKVNNSSTCRLKTESFLENKRSSTLKLDESTNFITINYLDANKTEKLVVKNLTLNNYQITQNSLFSLDIDLLNRLFLRNDLIILNLGSVRYNTSKRPVSCSIWNNTSNLLSSDFKECNILNLSDIRIYTLKDLKFTNFTIKIDYLENPIFQTPSIEGGYYINNGFFSIESNKLNWSNLQKNSKFINEPKITYLKNQPGFLGEYRIVINTEIIILIDDVLYIIFPLDFNSNLTFSKIFAYIEYNNIRKPIKTWFFTKRSIALLGWNDNLPIKKDITFILDGILNPESINSSFQIILAKENFLNNIKKWGKGNLKIENSILDIGLIFIINLKFDNLFLREKTKINLNFTLDKKANKDEKLLVYFHYLKNETLKKIKPICFLTDLNEYKQKIGTCNFNGNKIEAIILSELIKDVNYSLEITDIPNPDYVDESSKNIELIIIDKNNKFITLNSNELLINHENFNFKKKENISFLEFDSLKNQYLKISRGFYVIQNIVVENGKTFEDIVTFNILNTFNGEIKSKPIKFLGIDSFSSSFGSLRTKFIIGASNLSALTEYSVEMGKKESQGNRYSELPFLNLLVTQEKISLFGKNTIKVYKGYKSLPIELVPSLIPVDPIYLDFLYPDGATPELIINDYVRQFLITSEKPNLFIIIKAESYTKPRNIRLLVRPSIEEVLINDFNINLNIVEKQINIPPIDFKFALSLEKIFGIDLNLTSNQDLLILYYIMPIFSFKEIKFKDVFKKIELGIKFENDIQYGYFSLEKTGKLVINDLNEETLYRIKFYFESPQGNGEGYKYFDFKTLTRKIKKGVFVLEFENKINAETRKNILCRMNDRFKLNTKVLWTDDGINCNLNLTTQYAQKYFNNTYNFKNSTIQTQEGLKNLNNNGIFSYNYTNNFDNLNNYSNKYDFDKTMFIKVYSSKEQNKLSYSYNTLNNIIKKNNAKSLFNFYLNGIANVVNITDIVNFKYDIFDEQKNKDLKIFNLNGTIFLKNFNFVLKDFETVNLLVLARDKKKINNTYVPNPITSNWTNNLYLNFSLNLDPNYDFNTTLYDQYYFNIIKKDQKSIELKNFNLTNGIDYKLYVVFYTDSRQYSIYNTIKEFDLLFKGNKSYILIWNILIFMMFVN